MEELTPRRKLAPPLTSYSTWERGPAPQQGSTVELAMVACELENWVYPSPGQFWKVGSDGVTEGELTCPSSGQSRRAGPGGMSTGELVGWPVRYHTVTDPEL